MLEIIHEAINPNPNLTITIILNLTPNLMKWIKNPREGPSLKLFTRVLTLTLTLI